ncbi:PROTEIN NPGR2 [Salix koriyanagi]|uniref:PROTEIN NPGR2 n=1 Tax=Salix koriyanagi TaxID=2511006 RepID=A0A9Q0TGA0_9ROSI|nr:PROTEIN NPGR2 [Salix koriyanagi]KAJ6711103.1 PROTEIN NPGR2 [Salix koriyanagi]
MEGLSSGDQSRTVAGMALSSEPLATKDNSTGAYSSKNGALDQQPDTSNLEEAELSLRGRGSLNYEEARALLGRMEYQKGNVEAALHVFEGINIAAVTPRMKATLAKRREHHKRRSQSFSTPPMSIHAASLLMEAILLKAKSLQHLGRFREAAQSCKVIVDIVESSFSEGLPENFAADFKLQETLNKAVELLPELWKLADSPREAIMSYRRALLNQWNLDVETTSRIQKDFAILLLYSGGEASPPNLRSQMDSSFVPKNNIEEAILLLMILLRKIILKRIERDPSILDHLSFALSVSGGLKALARQVEELLPGIIDRNERYHILSLCYYGAGEELIALDLLRKLLHVNEDPNCVPALLMASKICGKTPKLAEEGINYARRALQSLKNNCNQLESVAYCLLGVSLSAHSQVAVADSVRATKQFEALEALESAGRMTKMRDSNILYHLSLENAEQRKLDVALYYAKHLLKLESGSNIRGWLLLARILSAQRQYKDAETIINAALDQTGKWDQGELLRTKAKLQIAQGQLESGIASYIQLLAVLRIQSKSLGLGTKLYKILQDNENPPGLLELEVWHDLASVYIRLSRWHDAETCLSKSKAICSYSASRCHTTGVLYEGKGLYKEALKAFGSALEIDPTHVPSMVSTAVVLRRLRMQSSAARSFLMGALRLDRMNSSAWYNLGLLYKAEGAPSSSLEAAECFEAATFLEETAPAEPFR